jgi:hypothetical protein
LSARAGHARRAAIVALLAALAAACSKPPPPSPWQRPDVSPATTAQVELDCRQRAIEAMDPGNNPEDARRVHDEREQYVARCMIGSGFTRR